MKRLKAWIAAWRQKREMRRRYKACNAGIDYVLSVLREGYGPEILRHLQEQADSNPDSPFCFGMRIAINGWKS